MAPIAPLGTPSGAAGIGVPPAVCDSPSSRGSPPMPGRPRKPLLHTSCRQVWIRPDPSSPADSRASMAGPTGPQPSSSSRDQSTRTGRPGSSRASSTASAAASSEALCPYTPAPSTWCTVSWPGSRPSPAASARRSGNGPWLCVHTVIRGVPSGPLSQRAIAQLGAIEACAMNGRVNSACRSGWHPGRRGRVVALHHRLVLGGLAEQEALQVPLVGQRLADRPPGRPGQPGRGGHRDPVPAGQHAEERAVPQHVASTPSGRSTAATPSSVAAGPGGRITRPNTMPGSTRSCRNRGRPVALSGRSRRGALRPATDHWLAGLATAGSAAARSSRPGSSSVQ